MNSTSTRLDIQTCIAAYLALTLLYFLKHDRFALCCFWGRMHDMHIFLHKMPFFPIQIDVVLRLSIHDTTLPALSAIVIFNNSVLWNGNFGRRNGSDPSSPPPNEYTVYRWALLSSVVKTFVRSMLDEICMISVTDLYLFLETGSGWQWEYWGICHKCEWLQK